MRIAYTIEIGSTTISNDPAGGPPLVALRVERGVGGAGGRARIGVGRTEGAAPRVGDEVRVEIRGAISEGNAFRGEVDGVSPGIDTVVVEARDGLARLAEHEVERAYEEVTAGFIVADLVDASGATVGQVEDGPTFSRYVVYAGPRALQHVQRLAALVGAELLTDGDGKVCFVRPREDAPAQRLRWGEHLLRVELEQAPLSSDSLVVWGEGAAGTDGAEREHWLATDLSGAKGEAAVDEAGGQRRVMAGRHGERPRALVDGAIRSAEVADEIARAHVQRLALRPLRGSVLALGLPHAAPGTWVELSDLPDSLQPLAAAPSLRLRVRHVVHHLSPARGLLTELRF